MPLFTTKHYREIASVLQGQKMALPEAHHRALVGAFAEKLQTDNPRFKRDLFARAAGITNHEETL